MAQTMPDVSFGPIVCCSHSNVTYFVNNTLHILQISSQCTKIYEEKGKTHLGPKQCQMHCLSQFWSLPPSIAPLLHILQISTYICYKNLVSSKKYEEKKKDHSSSAQTMHLASSGPVLVIAIFHHSPVTYFVNKILYKP